MRAVALRSTPVAQPSIAYSGQAKTAGGFASVSAGIEYVSNQLSTGKYYRGKSIAGNSIAEPTGLFFVEIFPHKHNDDFH